jgi:membrane-bound ClpP family serine protease
MSAWREVASVETDTPGRREPTKNRQIIFRAIYLTDPEIPLDLVLHTPGGLLLAATQIARAVLKRKGKVTVFVPHYAMSGGTLIALAANNIVMSEYAVLGPVSTCLYLIAPAGPCREPAIELAKKKHPAPATTKEGNRGWASSRVCERCRLVKSR